MYIAIMLLTLSIIFLIVGIYLSAKASSDKYKKFNLSVDGFLHSSLFVRIGRIFKPDDNSKKGQLLLNKLSILPFKCSLSDLYVVKLYSAVAVLFLTMSVTFTNFQLYKSIIVADTKDIGISQLGPVQQTSTVNATSKEFTEMYNLVDSELDLSSEISKPKDVAVSDISNVLVRSLKITSEQSRTLAQVIYYKATQVGTFIDSKHFSTFLMMLGLGFILPTLILSAYYRFRKHAFVKEIYNLESQVLLLGGISTVTTKAMILGLIDYARIFRPLLTEFYSIYCTDRVKAYKFIIGSGVDTNFEGLMSVLRMCEFSDRNAAIDSLNRKRQSKHEFAKVERDTKLERKDLYCLMAYFIIFILLMAMLIAPFVSQLSVLSMF